VIKLNEFFATAREREQIRLRRVAGETHLTDDPIFQQWRFCNVRREDDKTTVWFRENVRSKLSGLPVIEATVAFRWFNRIEVGERIVDLLLNITNGWDRDEARNRLENVRPVTNGAYIVSSPTGFSKLDGVLQMIDDSFDMLEGLSDDWGPSLEEAHRSLLEIPFMGRFIAYEVVTDLRWTDVLQHADDINTWASAGPGCARGLGRVVADDPRLYNYGTNGGQSQMLGLMREILDRSRKEWPASWPRWEMREVEHWLCEFDKYERARNGERLKRRFA
jgi:hypothetical protein